MERFRQNKRYQIRLGIFKRLWIILTTVLPSRGWISRRPITPFFEPAGPQHRQKGGGGPAGASGIRLAWAGDQEGYLGIPRPKSFRSNKALASSLDSCSRDGGRGSPGGRFLSPCLWRRREHPHRAHEPDSEDHRRPYDLFEGHLGSCDERFSRRYEPGRFDTATGKRPFPSVGGDQADVHAVYFQGCLWRPSLFSSAQRCS